MPAYSGKAQPYLDAIAASVFTSQEVRNWLIKGTPAEANYAGSSVLTEEQRALRWQAKPTKQPFWANYWCGPDSRCSCRIDGSKGLESDAIFFFRNSSRRVLAVHVEFKHVNEAFSFGQPGAARCGGRIRSSTCALVTHAQAAGAGVGCSRPA
jgi:hypothetical protein